MVFRNWGIMVSMPSLETELKNNEFILISPQGSLSLFPISYSYLAFLTMKILVPNTNIFTYFKNYKAHTTPINFSRFFSIFYHSNTSCWKYTESCLNHFPHVELLLFVFNFRIFLLPFLYNFVFQVCKPLHGSRSKLYKKLSPEKFCSHAYAL